MSLFLFILYFHISINIFLHVVPIFIPTYISTLNSIVASRISTSVLTDTKSTSPPYVCVWAPFLLPCDTQNVGHLFRGGPHIFDISLRLLVSNTLKKEASPRYEYNLISVFKCNFLTTCQRKKKFRQQQQSLPLHPLNNHEMQRMKKFRNTDLDAREIPKRVAFSFLAIN